MGKLAVLRGNLRLRGVGAVSEAWEDAWSEARSAVMRAAPAATTSKEAFAEFESAVKSALALLDQLSAQAVSAPLEERAGMESTATDHMQWLAQYVEGAVESVRAA